jgi:hypothetical protein
MPGLWRDPHGRGRGSAPVGGQRQRRSAEPCPALLPWQVRATGLAARRCACAQCTCTCAVALACSSPRVSVPGTTSSSMPIRPSAIFETTVNTQPIACFGTSHHLHFEMPIHRTPRPPLRLVSDLPAVVRRSSAVHLPGSCSTLRRRGSGCRGNGGSGPGSS